MEDFQRGKGVGTCSLPVAGIGRVDSLWEDRSGSQGGTLGHEHSHVSCLFKTRMG